MVIRRKKHTSFLRGHHVVDNLYGTDNSVAVRSSNFIHNGRADSYSARHCNHCGFAACHSGAESSVILKVSARRTRYTGRNSESEFLQQF